MIAPLVVSRFLDQLEDVMRQSGLPGRHSTRARWVPQAGMWLITAEVTSVVNDRACEVDFFLNLDLVPEIHPHMIALAVDTIERELASQN